MRKEGLISLGQDIQEATASEPLTLEEEYENQQSWRTSHDKLTFIICQPVPAPATSVEAGDVDGPARMVGDINFFVYPHDEDEDAYVGEVDVMIATGEHRGKGIGRAAVAALLTYVHRRQEQILGEYADGEGKSGGKKPVLKGLMVKIKEGNAASIALFKKIGFTQKGEVNYFGEIEMVLGDLDQFVASPAGLKAAEEFREVTYSR